MNLKHVLSAGLALFVIGLVAPTSQAAPVVGPAGTADSEVAGSLVEKVHRRYRYRYHRSYDDDSYDYDDDNYYRSYDSYRSYRYPYYHRRYHGYDHYPYPYSYPIPPFRNERWWFRNSDNP